MKKIYVSVVSDMVSDQRVHKISSALVKWGFDVQVICRRLNKKETLEERPYKCKRFDLIFNKGPLFYAEMNIRLFIYLIFRRSGIYLANDLDTLLANFIVAKVKRKPVVYDSHEYFTGVPEIQHRRLVKKAWEFIEKITVPGLKIMYTVNDSIAKLYREKYQVEFKVIRNIAPQLSGESNLSTTHSFMTANEPVIILQGSGINVDRGAEEAVLAMKQVKKGIFYIIGKGDVVPDLKNLVANENLSEKVKFIDRLPYNELRALTLKAHVGLSLDKPTNPNYEFSLPNKLFDYIQSGVPVVTSNVIEVAKIVHEYQIGYVVDEVTPDRIAEKINSILDNPEILQKFKENALIAAKKLCWEEEEKNLYRIYKQFID